MKTNNKIHTPVYNIDEIADMAQGFDINTKILKSNAYQNIPLDFDTAYLLGIFTLASFKPELNQLFSQDSELIKKQSIAALCTLHNKSTYSHPMASEQIAGIVAAIFDYDIGTSKNGFLYPNIDYAMDNCGMGGDLFRTANVSTIAALIAASDNIPMIKHGSPGNTDSTGSSDFLLFLGLNLFAKKSIVEKGLEQINFGYTDALNTGYKTIHVQTHKDAQLTHMNDIIGPITNPINPKCMKKRVLGINHLMDPVVVAQAYKTLNERGVTDMKHGLFVRGFVTNARNGGIDEISVFPGGTKVAELKNGHISLYNLTAENFGISPQEYIEPPKDMNGKARLGKEILDGKVNNAHTSLVLANAAALEYLAKGITLKEGYQKSEELLKSGKAKETIQNCVELYRG